MRRLQESGSCRLFSSFAKKPISALTIVITTMALSLSFTSATAMSGEMNLHGINLAGAEFGSIGEPYGKGYIYPSDETVAAYAKDNFNAIRLPFLWERLQPNLKRALDATELARIQDTVKIARKYKMVVILDPHNYARYQGEVIGSDEVPVEAFADFWKRLSAIFANNDDVIFGLMNEPHNIEATSWLEAANAAIKAIRNIGAGNLVLVPGTAWSGAHSWEQDYYGPSNASVMKNISDPSNNFAFEVHQYSDSDYSGKHVECSRSSEAVSAIQAFTNWLNANNFQGLLGEFGTIDQPDCLASLKQMVDIVHNNPNSWIGWTYWAGGEWWPKGDPMIIQADAQDGGQAILQALKPLLDDTDTPL